MVRRAARPSCLLAGQPQGVLFPPGTPRRTSVLLRQMADILEELPALDGEASLREARQFAARHVLSAGILTELSTERMLTLWTRLERFAARGHGVLTVGDVSDALARAFLEARTTKGTPPSLATQHLRRSALRLLFRVLREFRVCAFDPTIDLHLPARSRVPFRALTDDEIELARWASLSTLTMTRRPAVWALAEAGASSSEIPHVTVADLSLDTGEVWIAGGPKTESRSAALTEWGHLQLARRVQALPTGSTSTPLTYTGEGSGCSARTTSSEAIRVVLRHAGLLHEPGVRVRSVTAWVGQRILAETSDISAVARRLGLRSLDLAAELIAWDWRGDAVA